MHLPLVSVIISTRNRLTIFQNALRSVYEQDYPDLEILVVDDASEDGTSDYVRSHHPDVRLFHFEVNRGYITARNLMMREAKGDYIVSLDDDAFFLTPQSISGVVRRMEAEPELAVVTFRELIRKEDAERTAEPERYTATYIGCGHCIRKAVLRETGDYGEYAVREGEEADLALRILNRGYYIAFFPGAVVMHGYASKGRDFKLWHISGPRNLLLRSWVNEPFPWWLVTTANGIVKYLIRGMRTGTLPYVLKGFGSAFKAWPQAWSIRRPVSSKTMRVNFALRQKTVTEVSEMQKLYQSPPTFLSLLLRKRL
jgi:GT2 family glycosyltransferase